jgi:hypothetical protein
MSIFNIFLPKECKIVHGLLNVKEGREMSARRVQQTNKQHKATFEDGKAWRIKQY